MVVHPPGSLIEMMYTVEREESARFDKCILAEMATGICFESTDT